MTQATTAPLGLRGSLNYVRNRLKDGLRRFLPPHRRLIRTGEAFLRGGEREVHKLGSLVAPGSVAIDIGAHIGDYTYSLCRHVGPQGKVIAIEPIPDLARNLERAVRRLQLPVSVLNCALSSRDGEADLLIPVDNGERVTAFATLEQRSTGGKHRRVSVRRLDDITRDIIDPISFVKIDVEGHELQVLRGSTETLKRHHPNLLIEIEQRHSPVPIAETFAYVLSLGYSGEFLDADGQFLPLAAFDMQRHQSRQIEHVGTRHYVSNFIFRPTEKAQPAQADMRKAGT